MVTPDKDFGQLVSENIFIYKPGRMGEKAVIMGIPEVCEKFGIKRPAQVIDMLGLWGDASDNVPGVKGVGEIGSKKLINEYGSVENIYNKISNLSEKLQKSFIEAKDYIELSKKLVTIDTDVDVEFDEDKEYMLIGSDNRVKIETLIGALGDLYEIDLFEIMSRYSKRIAQK